jgi:hypothetical protein
VERPILEDLTCRLTYTNARNEEVILVLEPEAVEFHLPAMGSIQILLYGKETPIEIRESVTDGVTYVSFWPDKGNYELLYKGNRIWDIL